MNMNRVNKRLPWLKWVLSAILILNVVDSSCTIYFVNQGTATEGNPFMAIFINSPLLFAFVKFILVIPCAGILWIYRKRKLALAGIILLFFAYYSIVTIHFYIWWCSR